MADSTELAYPLEHYFKRATASAHLAEPRRAERDRKLHQCGSGKVPVYVAFAEPEGTLYWAGSQFKNPGSIAMPTRTITTNLLAGAPAFGAGCQVHGTASAPPS